MSLQHSPAEPDQDPDYLNCLISEDAAAEFLGVARKTLQMWRTQGRGPKFVKMSARMVRYRRRDLIHHADSCLVSSTAEL